MLSVTSSVRQRLKQRRRLAKLQLRLKTRQKRLHVSSVDFKPSVWRQLTRTWPLSVKTFTRTLEMASTERDFLSKLMPIGVPEPRESQC